MAPFELTDELISEIIFAMEDQDSDWVVGIEDRQLVSADEIDEADAEPGGQAEPRYVPIPVWEPADGFHLMERFVERLRNEELQSRLRDALAARRGVFRAFKNVLRENPAFEKRWHRFKDQEMRAAVVDWYNDLRVAWGLAPIEIPEEPPDELLLTDIDVRAPGDADLAGFEKMRHAGREALITEYPEMGVFLEDQLTHAQTPAPIGENGHVRALVAEAASGELCGYICGTAAPAVSAAVSAWPAEVRSKLAIEEIFVWPEYRGLGIGRLLIQTFIDVQQTADERTKPLVQLLGSAVVLAGLLHEEFETIGLFLRPR